MTGKKFKSISNVFIILIFITSVQVWATDISDNTFLIGKINPQNINNKEIWDLLKGNNATGIEIEVGAKNRKVILLNSIAVVLYQNMTGKSKEAQFAWFRFTMYALVSPANIISILPIPTHKVNL